MVLVFGRGRICPKDRRQSEKLFQLHREIEVGYCRLVTISTDKSPRPMNIAPASAPAGHFFPTRAVPSKRFRHCRIYRSSHNPMIPHAIVLEPGLVIYKIYNGYWFCGQPTLEELRQDFRAVT